MNMALVIISGFTFIISVGMVILGIFHILKPELRVKGLINTWKLLGLKVSKNEIDNTYKWYIPSTKFLGIIAIIGGLVLSALSAYLIFLNLV